MQHESMGNSIKVWTPATYRIQAQGCLDKSWSDRLWGMRIKNSSQPGQAQVTTLVGHLRDQAALFGVLNNLYELHLPILSVEHQNG